MRYISFFWRFKVSANRLLVTLGNNRNLWYQLKMKNFYILLFLCAFAISLSGCSKSIRPPLGLNNQKQLMPCPNSPNCVSSFESDKAYIPPFHARSGTDPIQELKKCLSRFPAINVLENSNHYLRGIATSSIFGFIDDIEFLLIGDSVYIRSASRSGYYDFNKNRERIERIRQVFTEGCR